MQLFIFDLWLLFFFLQVATALTCLRAVASHFARLDFFFSFLHFARSFWSSVFLTIFVPQTALFPVAIELTSFAFVVRLICTPFWPTNSVGRFCGVAQRSPKPLKAECGPRGSLTSKVSTGASGTDSKLEL